jgi:hypothetical protein
MTRHPAVAVLAIAATLGVGAVFAPTRLVVGPSAADEVDQRPAATVIDEPSRSSPSRSERSRSWPITYRVTGDGTMASSITWTDGSSQSQAVDVPLPWTVSLPAGSLPGHIVLAQAGDGSTISCTIMQGRELMDATTGAGRGAIALCQE